MTYVSKMLKTIEGLQKANRELEEKNRAWEKAVADILNSFENCELALLIKEAHDAPEVIDWLTARELAPRELTNGEASAFGKRLTDAYVFVTKAEPPLTREGRLYPSFMSELWSTYCA